MEHQFKPWQPVIVRDHASDVWRAQFFSHYNEKDKNCPYCCITRRYRQCLPAEGNEHLIGTRDNPTPPEPEFKFGDKVKVRDVDGKWLNAIFIQKKQDGNGTGEYYEVRFVNDILGYFGKHHIRHADW